ncbi:M60 family metallopeptidase [Streptomyces sp. NRRL S-350]|uniref:M60 family metallopeptidase n=1 Tax=Streptomyces sp. NRRL S-350 TaxID=1463902 RepID=UPI0004C0EC37|nr:M60 family metallopeptidase [Streptomyces sp. NRRL S-350]
MITRLHRCRGIGSVLVAGLSAGALLAGCSGATSPQPAPSPSHVSSSPSSSSPRDLAFEATPSESAEQKRLATTFHPDDAQPTGLYLPPNTPVTVTVDRPADAPAPVLLVGTYGLNGTDSGEEEEPRTHELPAATTTVSDPTGGLLYVRYTNDGGSAPGITVHFGETARPVPYHVLGATPAAQWRSALDAAKDVPVAQLVGEHLVLTVSLDSARRNAGQDPDALLREYEHILAVEDTISGLDGKDPRDRRSPLRYFVSEGRAGINPNAYYPRVCYPSDSIDEVLNVPTLKESWGMWHELGHMHQQTAWTWDAVTEVTVNVYSLAVQRDAGRPSRLADDGTPAEVRTYLTGPAARRSYDPMADKQPFVGLTMFEQLRLAFGDGFYPELHRLTRRSATPATAEEAGQYFAVNASRVSGRNLTGFFTAWGLPVNAKTRADVTALGLPAPEQDPTTLAVAKAP